MTMLFSENFAPPFSGSQVRHCYGCNSFIMSRGLMRGEIGGHENEAV